MVVCLVAGETTEEKLFEFAEVVVLVGSLEAADER